MNKWWGPWYLMGGLLCGMILTMMTQDIWSAHTSYQARNDLSQFARSYQQVIDQIETNLTDLSDKFDQIQATKELTNQELERRALLRRLRELEKR